MTTPSAELKLLNTAIEMLEDAFLRGGLTSEQIIKLKSLKEQYAMVSLTNSFEKLNTKNGGRTKRQRHRKKRRSTAQRY